MHRKEEKNRCSWLQNEREMEIVQSDLVLIQRTWQATKSRSSRHMRFKSKEGVEKESRND